MSKTPTIESDQKVKSSEAQLLRDRWGFLAFLLGIVPGFAVIGNFGFADDYGQMALTKQQEIGWMKSMLGCGRPLQILTLGVWKLFGSLDLLWIYHTIAALVGGVLAWTLYRLMHSLGCRKASALLVSVGVVGLVPGLLIQIAWLQMFPFLVATIASVVGARWLLEGNRRPWLAGLLFGAAWLCYQPSALVGVVLLAATPFVTPEGDVLRQWRSLWWKPLALALLPLGIAGVASAAMVKLVVAAHWAKASGRHQFLGKLSQHIHVWLHLQLPMAFRLWSPFRLSHRWLFVELLLGFLSVMVALKRRRSREAVIATGVMLIASCLLAFATAAVDVYSRALVASQVAVAIMVLSGLVFAVEWTTQRWKSVTVVVSTTLALVLSLHAFLLLHHDYEAPNRLELNLVSRALTPDKCRTLRYIVLAPPARTILGPVEADEFGSPTTKAPWMSQKLVQLVCSAHGVPGIAMPTVVSTNSHPDQTVDFKTILDP